MIFYLNFVSCRQKKVEEKKDVKYANDFFTRNSVVFLVKCHHDIFIYRFVNIIDSQNHTNPKMDNVDCLSRQVDRDYFFQPFLRSHSTHHYHVRVRSHHSLRLPRCHTHSARDSVCFADVLPWNSFAAFAYDLLNRFRLHSSIYRLPRLATQCDYAWYAICVMMKEVFHLDCCTQIVKVNGTSSMKIENFMWTSLRCKTYPE